MRPGGAARVLVAVVAAARVPVAAAAPAGGAEDDDDLRVVVAAAAAAEVVAARGAPCTRMWTAERSGSTEVLAVPVRWPSGARSGANPVGAAEGGK